MTSTEIASASKVMLGTTEAVAMYIGSTQIWSAGGGGSQYQANGLPTGWTELQYIEATSSGSQYLDMNIKLYETLGTQYDLAIKFNMTGKGSDNQNQATFFSTAHSTSPYPGLFLRRSNNDVNGRYIGVNNANGYVGSIGSIIELPTPASGSHNVYRLKNENRTGDMPTTIFCAMEVSNNDTGWSPYRYASGYLYYFRLWVEGTLVRDLIPCKDTNNVVGMYDIVNHVFYTSPNGAAFVAGPTV